MNKKLLFVFSLILCMSVILCACETPYNPPESTETVITETPEPTPTPEPECIVFAGQPEYFEKTQKYFSEDLGCNIKVYETIDQIDDSLNIVGLIAITDEVSPKLLKIAENAKAVVCTKQDISPNGFSVIRLSGSDNADAEFLDAAIAYPYHDTPVRFIAMFEYSDKLATVYDSYYDQGKIFSKERYAPGETPASEWLLGKLNDKYIEGMIDAIICETPELAKAACDIMLSLNWSNTEVFCAADSNELRTYAQQHPKLMAIRVGTNSEAVDDAILNEIKGLFDGKANETVPVLSGVIVSE